MTEARDVNWTEHSLTEEGRLLEDIANSETDGAADFELEREPTADAAKYDMETESTIIVGAPDSHTDKPYEWDGPGDEDDFFGIGH